MIHRFLISATTIGCMLFASYTQAIPATAPAPASSDFFGEKRLRTIHIKLSAEAWKRMHPTVRPRFEPRRMAQTRPTTASATQPARPTEDAVVRSPLGYEYRPAAGTLELDQEPPTEIAIRFKGNLSYAISASGPRRPMKIEFDQTDPNRRFHGLATLNLNTSSTDPSMLRESLGFALFRDAGIPAPRTAFALVYLTVDKQYNREFLGLFTLVEQVDREFLQRHFGDGSGMLLKPEMLRGLPYLGSQWATYQDRYNPKENESEKAGQTFIEFLRLVHFGDDAAFRQRIGSFMAIDSFLRFLAVQTMIVNFDGFLCTGHNYYLYQNPLDGRFHWMPWDLDLSFGSFGIVAAPPHQVDLSLFRPYVPPNRLLERLLAVDEFREAYHGHLRQLAAETFSADRIRQRITDLKPFLHQAELAAQAAKRSGSPTTRPAGMAGVPPLETFLAGRLESIRTQLAGRQDAFIPGQSKGLLLANAWDETRRDSLAQSVMLALRSILRPSQATRIQQADLLAAVRSRFADLQSQHAGPCDHGTLVESLANVLPVPANFVFDPGPGPEWAAILFRRADADHDAQLTWDELAAAIAQAFREADANKDGALDQAELLRALRQLAVKP